MNELQYDVQLIAILSLYGLSLVGIAAGVFISYWSDDSHAECGF